MRTVIGVSALYHDAAAAAVTGTEIIAAAQEERFSRRKHDPRFPCSALQYCIEQVGGAAKVDAVAFYEDPALSFDRVLKNTIDLAPATEGLWPVVAASQLGEKINVMERLARTFGFGFLPLPIPQCRHCCRRRHRRVGLHYHRRRNRLRYHSSRSDSLSALT